MHLQPIFILKFVFEIKKNKDLHSQLNPDILAEMTSEVTTRNVKKENQVILKEVITFFRELVVFVNDNFVCSRLFP